MLSKYSYENTIQAEQFNTLLVIDQAVASQGFDYIPEFHLVGGTALIFHGLSHEMTIDIDTGNRIEAMVKDVVDPLINDNASEVIIRGNMYMERLIPYKQDVFKHIQVYLFSLEDLLISKCGTGRRKDLNDIMKTGLLVKVDKKLLKKIVDTELSSKEKEKVMTDIGRIYTLL